MALVTIKTPKSNYSYWDNVDSKSNKRRHFSVLFIFTWACSLKFCFIWRLFSPDLLHIFQHMHDDTRRQSLRCVTLPLQSVKIYPWHFQTQCRSYKFTPTLLVAMSSINDFRDSTNSMNSDSNTTDRMCFILQRPCKGGLEGLSYGGRDLAS